MAVVRLAITKALNITSFQKDNYKYKTYLSSIKYFTVLFIPSLVSTRGL